MELRQLKYFVTVAEIGTMSGASRQLNLAQPAISSAIKKLETELDTPLFYRKDKGVSLTVAGKDLLQHAKQILKQADDAKLSISNLGALDTGEVEFGVPTMIGSYYFPPILMAFKHQYPGLQLNVIDGGTRDIQQMLLNDELELGVIADQYLTPELEGVRLVREEMVVCMSEDHPLAALDEISYQDFLAHELVLFQTGYYHHTLIKRISREENVAPKIAFTSNLLPLIKSLIRQGYAISPMWKMAIQEDDTLVSRRFTKPFYIELSLAWKKGRYISHANQAFRDFVLESIAEGE